MEFINAYLVRRLTEERAKDALREAEHARLVRVAKESREGRPAQFRVGAGLSSLASLVASWVGLKT